MASFEEKYRPSNRAKTSPAAPATSATETLKAAESETARAKDDYKVFSAQTQAQFDLWIRPNAANASPGLSIPYSRRANMTHDDGWFVLIMHFDSGPVLSVRLHGRNLEELFLKLLAHEAVYVREFDSRKWAEVPDGEPCITGIDVRYRPGPVPKNDDDLPGEGKEPETTARH